MALKQINTRFSSQGPSRTVIENETKEKSI